MATLVAALLACHSSGEASGDDDGASGDDAATTDAAEADQDAAGQDAVPPPDAYQPAPIPAIDAEPPALCDSPTPGRFQFLDDSCQAKRFPDTVDRDLACPSSDPSPVIALTGGGTVTYTPSSSPVVVDDEALTGLIPTGLDITVILIRRVDGVPHYRYLSNGSHDDAYQPWSTTKFLAAANAAASLRVASSYAVGLTGSVGATPLGDLVTSLHNYDDDPYSSNGLGKYFHNIGGRARANDLIHALWLDRPAGETFGGNYGVDAPPLGYTFSDTGDASVTISPDATAGPANHLASFTTAEALKRLVLHREEATQRLPGIQWLDVATLLYGADGSTKYGAWGGMSADPAIYLQSGHDIDYLAARSRGRWRIFSKLGLGSSGQFLDVGYGCFPVLDDQLHPVPGWGREVIIASHLPEGGSSWAERDRILARAYRAILIRVIDGRL